MNPRGTAITQESHFPFSFEFPSYEQLYSAGRRGKKKKNQISKKAA